MEVCVSVSRAWIKDTQRFGLRCRVQAVVLESSGEAHEGSVSISQPITAALTDKPHRFFFSFASRPAHLSLLFVATSPRQDLTSSRQEKELGRCTVTISTAEPPDHAAKTLFLTRQMEDSRVERLAGKLKCTVRFSDKACVSLRSLLSDEAERACMDVMPSESPFVSVVFHCATAVVDPATTELVGVARIGDRSDIGIDTLLQQSSAVPLLCLPLLKPVRLFCEEYESLELHIADTMRGTIQFSSARVLSRLTPFKPIHFNFDGGQSQGLASRTQSDTERPNVSVSVVYTPSAAQSSMFEGIEVAICDIIPPRSVLQARDIVLGTQLVEASTKGKTPSLAGYFTRPPFKEPVKKKGGSFSSDYHISVLKHQEREVNTTPVVKSYYLFHDTLQGAADFCLLFHVFASSGAEVWWNTDTHTWVKLDISKETLAMLKTGDLPTLHWSATNKDSSQPCTVSGILRWKSSKEKFLTESYVREILATHTHVSPGPVRDQHSTGHTHKASSEQLPQPEGLKPADDNSATADVKVFQQLTEFLRQTTENFLTLRRENQHLERENERLRMEVARIGSTGSMSDSLGQRDLQTLSVSELRVGVCSLQHSLESERKMCERYRERNRALQSDLAALRDVEARHVVLRESHMGQQKLIQSLRDKLTKYRKCSEICRKQESVITHLESLLAKQAQGHPSAKYEAISMLSRENAELRTLLHVTEDSGSSDLDQKNHVIYSLKSQLSQLAAHCKNLEREIGRGGGTRSEEKRELELQVFELEQKLLVAEAKLSAQSQQLQENAERWMTEKAGYELQLADHRHQLDSFIRSGQQALMATATTQGEPATTSKGQRENKGEGSRTSREHRESEGEGRGKQQTSGKKDFSF